MNIYLADLKFAFGQVEKEHYSWWCIKDIKDNNTELNKYYLQSIERSFAYQLYFYWMTLIKDKKDNYVDLILNGEINKGHLWNKPDFKIQDFGFLNYNMNTTSFIPDLTLHKGQSYLEYQKLVVEIKTDIKPNLTDLPKLGNLIFNYNFEFGVFLVINNKFLDIKKHIKNSFNASVLNEYTEIYKKIIIMSRKSVHEEIYVTSLYDILNEE